MLQGNIGIMFQQQGKLDDAEQMYNESLQIGLKVFGEGSLDVAGMLKNIADVRKAQGRYDEAVEMYTSVLQVQERLFGRNHLDVAKTHNKYACTRTFIHACDAYMSTCSIATIHERQGKLREALEL